MADGPGRPDQHLPQPGSGHRPGSADSWTDGQLSMGRAGGTHVLSDSTDLYQPSLPDKKTSNSSQSLTEKKNRSGDMKYRETVADILGFGDLKRSVADLEDSEDSDSELLEFFSSSNLTKLNILTSCLQLKIFKKN